METVHLSAATLIERLEALPPAPRDAGRVVLVVSRPAVGERRTPERCALSVEGGVDGDRWAARENPVRASQVTVMRADVAGVIANGQPLSLFGDNLLVELDLSAENLPDRTRLRIGTALCAVTPKPHNGCAKFGARFGQHARDVLSSERFASWRLRGLHVEVIEPGETSPGDRIEVLRHG